MEWWVSYVSKEDPESWNPPLVFDMLQYFETILPSVESLWSSLEDEVYFMGSGAAGGLCLSPNMVAILDFINN